MLCQHVFHRISDVNAMRAAFLLVHVVHKHDLLESIHSSNIDYAMLLLSHGIRTSKPLVVFCDSVM